jgi:hypothetical protein
MGAAGKWRRSAMSNSGVLVECHCRLGAKVAICALELPRGNAMLTTGTLEQGTALHRFGRVASHSSILVRSGGTVLNQKA